MILSFYIGKTRIVFHFWFFVVILLFLITDYEVLAWYIALPIVIHESGHFLSMAVLRVSIQAVEFTPVSVNIKRRSQFDSTLLTDIIINLAGITSNLLAAAWMYFHYFQSMRIMFLIAANVVVAVFNLLPIGNLDGGVLCKLICERLWSLEMARSISRLVSFMVLTPLFACSIYLLLQGFANITLFLTTIYLAVTVAFRE